MALISSFFPKYWDLEGRYFIILVTDGFQTENEITVKELLNTFVAKLPTQDCQFVHLFLTDECRHFRSIQGLESETSPFAVLCEQNPFKQKIVGPRAVIVLSVLKSKDQVKEVMALLAEQAANPEFVKKAKFSELLRRIERAFGRYGQPIRDCLSVVVGGM